MLSASSYGHFTAAKEFRSQCHIFRFGNIGYCCEIDIFIDQNIAYRCEIDKKAQCGRRYFGLIWMETTVFWVNMRGKPLNFGLIWRYFRLVRQYFGLITRHFGLL